MAAHTITPPLRDGERLTSGEFLRRWEAMPGLKHAELIDGIVYMPSPVSRQHSDCHVVLTMWLGIYAVNTPGCWPSLESTWLMGEGNVPQPDCTLRLLPEHGGQSRDEGNYTAGGPELALEVAVSSGTQDLGAKLKLYERMKVREYLVAVTKREEFLWNRLTATGYQAIKADRSGILRSRCFPGLWLDTKAFWSRDHSQLLAVLQQGLASPEHAAFIASLSAR